MHFYRPLNSIKAITFDLDDTLYDNAPYMVQAVDQMMAEIQRIDGLQHCQLAEFDQVKRDILNEQPELYHDVIVWRVCTIKQFLRKQGISDSAIIERITDDAMSAFIYWRNQIEVPDDSHQILKQLAKHYPLVVITNGNAEISKIGLQMYFKFALRAGADGLSKPYPDLFWLAAKRLAIHPQHVLHIGDNLQTDVAGAINSGMLACWLNVTGQDIYHCRDASVLPHMEITHLSVLNCLL